MKSIIEEYGIFIIEFILGIAALTMIGLTWNKLSLVLQEVFKMILGG